MARSGCATSTQVDWDQFNGIMQPEVRSGEQTDIKGLAQATSDPSGERPLLSTLGPALRTAGEAVLGAARRADRELPALIRSTATALHAISTDDADLGGFVDGAEQTFAATADESGALRSSLAAMPPALRATTATMHQLDPSIAKLGRLAKALLPGAVRLGSAMRALLTGLVVATNRLVQALPPLLRVSSSAIAALSSASNRGTAFLSTFKALIKQINGQIVPFFNELDPTTGLKVEEAIGPAFAAEDFDDEQLDSSGCFLRDDSGRHRPADRRSLQPWLQGQTSAPACRC